MSALPGTRIQSVARATRMLMRVAQQPGAGVTELAQALGIAVPTAHHLLGTLCEEGLLARDAQRGYVLGPAVGVLADAFLREGTPEYLRAPLRELAASTGESTYLTAWRGGEIHALEAVEGGSPVRVGGMLPGPYRHPHARATGKLLLAFASAERRAAVLGSGPLEACTPHTIVDRAALDAELAEIRARGWSQDREEFIEGVSCLSAPALVNGVVIAAFTVSSPSQRFDQHHDVLLDAALHAAASAAGSLPAEGQAA